MPNSSPNLLDIDNVLTLGSELQSRRKSQVNNQAAFNYTNRAIITFVDAVSKMNEEVLVPSRLKDIEVRENDATELMPGNSNLYSFFQMLNTVKKDLFSSTLFYKAFQPVPSSNGSGQNSGRVTPTSLSRRSSYSVGSGNPNNTSLNGLGALSGSNRNLASPTLLIPPSNFGDKKLSSPGPMSPNGDNSPELLSPGGLSAALLPKLQLTYVSRATSLSSLLADAGHMTEMTIDEPLTQEERIQQITGCFMYHLSAIYTLMGHFTKSAQYIAKRYQEEMGNYS